MTTSSGPSSSQLIAANAVFEGGGMRAIAHIGALAVAEAQGYRWVNVAGTSAGAIVAALVAAGYSAAELYQIMSELDYRRFADELPHDLLHLHDLLTFLFRMGLHSGDYLETFLREKLRARGVQQFGDLRLEERQAAANPFLRYRLNVIAADITRGRMLRLPYDLEASPAGYGLDPDRLDVAWAVRMSAGIPFFYVPVRLMHRDGSISYIVDGGLLSDFPLFLFERHEDGGRATRPTLGFRLVDIVEQQPSLAAPPPRNLLEFGQALLDTMLRAHDRLDLDEQRRAQTIVIPVAGVGATQFDLSRAEIMALYQQGEAAARRFFASRSSAAD
jgi:NTE family protein